MRGGDSEMPGRVKDPHPLFTPESRERLRDALVAAARDDERVVGAAHTGSAALGSADRWSDIDLALSVASNASMDDVVQTWTRRLYDEHGAVAHHDVWAGATRFRVFLLADTLQVDIAFWREGEFGAIGLTFRLIFGTPASRPTPGPPDSRELAGMAWLYALHLRSSIARGRCWQAEYMLSGMRDQLLAMMCVRHGVPAQQGRGMDDLPPQVTSALTDALVRSLDAAELTRAFGVTTEALLRELEHVDATLAHRLAPTLLALVTGEA